MNRRIWCFVPSPSKSLFLSQDALPQCTPLRTGCTRLKKKKKKRAPCLTHKQGISFSWWPVCPHRWNHSTKPHWKSTLYCTNRNITLEKWCTILHWKSLSWIILSSCASHNRSRGKQEQPRKLVESKTEWNGTFWLKKKSNSDELQMHSWLPCEEGR